MKIGVRLFAMYRELAGTRDLELELSEGSHVAQAWEACLERFPRLVQHDESAAFAVNGRYAMPDHVLQDRDELALFPPVSGGAHG